MQRLLLDILFYFCRTNRLIPSQINPLLNSQKLIPISYFLLVGALLFCIGVAVIVTKRNAILVLMGIELMLNAANLNLVAFNRLYPKNVEGQVFALFVIVVAAAEAAVALAIVLKVYQYFQTVNLDEVKDKKDK